MVGGAPGGNGNGDYQPPNNEESDLVVEGTVGDEKRTKKVGDVVEDLPTSEELTAMKAKNSIFAAALDGEDATILDSGVVNFDGDFDDAVEDEILVPSKNEDYEDGSIYTVVFSDGTVLQVKCKKTGELWIPFPKDAAGIGFVVLPGDLKNNGAVKQAIWDAAFKSVESDFANEAYSSIYAEAYTNTYVEKTASGWKEAAAAADAAAAEAAAVAALIAAAASLGTAAKAAKPGTNTAANAAAQESDKMTIVEGDTHAGNFVEGDYIFVQTYIITVITADDFADDFYHKGDIVTFAYAADTESGGLTCYVFVEHADGTFDQSESSVGHDGIVTYNMNKL